MARLLWITYGVKLVIDQKWAFGHIYKAHKNPIHDWSKMSLSIQSNL